MNKIILITGTRKGLGKELAEYYLHENNQVIGCSRGEGSITHDNYSHYMTDISDEKEVTKMVRDIKKKYKRIDILINNAGVASMNSILLTPVSTVKKIFDTNVFGTFIMTREVSKVMIHHSYGRIVNFTTVATPLNLEGEAIYASSKSAIESFTKVSARELSSYGITVNAIGPGPIKTDLIKGVPQDKLDSLIQTQVINRFGTIEDVTNVIDFFIDEKSDFITSQIVYLGGVCN